jgi:hydrogenase nickel incorporation protein HypA/HybF
MHEFSIVEALVEQVEQELSRAGQRGRVKRLDVAVGRLSGVHCDSLRFAFELLAPGTVAEGASLEISEPLASSHCGQCGACREIEELVVSCPACGSHDIRIENGRDLMLQCIETED